MFNPVNWVGIVNRIDADLVIECGPGKVLINLIKKDFGFIHLHQYL